MKATLFLLIIYGAAMGQQPSTPALNANNGPLPPKGCTLIDKNTAGADCVTNLLKDSEHWTVETWPFPCKIGDELQNPDGTRSVCNWEGTSAPPKGTLRWVKIADDPEPAKKPAPKPAKPQEITGTPHIYSEFEAQQIMRDNAEYVPAVQAQPEEIAAYSSDTHVEMFCAGDWVEIAKKNYPPHAKGAAHYGFCDQHRWECADGGRELVTSFDGKKHVCRRLP